MLADGRTFTERPLAAATPPAAPAPAAPANP
jgi:hypothetical protein